MINLYRSHLYLLWSIGILLITSTITCATHIVGGELELRYLGTQSANSHRINLNLYFDAVNGDPGADDAAVSVGIFAKRTNQLLGYVILTRISETPVPYTNTTCQTAYLKTILIRYTTDLTLDPNVFNDAGGYYMSWERCCRNQSITNIQTPGDAGSTFYLEFPALTNGMTNSSPVFAVPKGDYACIGQPFTLDFSAKDADNDSLTYTIVTPYNGYSNKITPNPGALTQQSNPVFYPGPYPTVNWITSIGVANEIPGTQPLQVNARTGLLTVTPNRVGLHVFSVQVDEYRKGVRIGRVRRDFQVLVVDCPKNDPPKLLFRADGQAKFLTKNVTLTIAEKDTNCLNLYVTDPNPNQRIQIINMSGSLPNLTLTPGQLLTRTPNDTLQSKFCFGRCVGSDGKPVTLLVRATDDGCPQGLSDTISIRLTVIPSPNNKPVASTNLINNQSRITVGSSLSFTAFGNDIDNDNITIQAIGRGFSLAQAGMSFASGSGIGKVAQPFVWKPSCQDASRSNYIVDFIVTSTRCNQNLSDTVTVNLSAIGTPSRPPTVRTTLPKPTVELIVGSGDSASSAFTVIGDDPDRDTIQLTAVGRGFDYKAVGMIFTGKTGPVILQSPFSWKPTCDLMAGRAEATFVIDFIADDRSCQPNHTDTTTVTFVVKDPSVSAEIKIPNVITPNGDGYNDYFAVSGLPENSCAEQFISVEITNRYGRTVFTSTDPKFRWYATDDPAGTYYYLLKTSRQTFKGPLTVIR